MNDNNFSIDYKEVLYRRNNIGKPCFWYVFPTGEKQMVAHYGIVGNEGTVEVLTTHRKVEDEITTKINNKRKKGYKYLFEIKDNYSLPVEEELLSYLDKYLPLNNTTADGSLLPMLAKAYDNKDNKLFNKNAIYVGQYKINGLRCFISAYKEQDIFGTVRLKFQSREGTIWNTLGALEDYLLVAIDSNLLDKMLHEDYILDGELYLPGYTVNDINSFVKNTSMPQNKYIQFWCYDLAVENMTQEQRITCLDYFGSAFTIPKSMFNLFGKKEHLNIKRQLNFLPSYNVYNEEDAITLRDKFISYGFEGLIMRDLSREYQYGKRNLSMIKFKAHEDGLFTIIDIVPEGIKRPDIPMLICKNDINKEQFNCSLSGPLEYQRKILTMKDKYIGKQAYVEYGERSGVNQLPFHIKMVNIKNG